MKRTALIAGVNRYTDPLYRPLNYAVKDARDLWYFLKSTGSYDTVELIEPDDVTDDKIVDMAEALCGKLSRGDQFLFYFAGHGVQHDNDHLLLCPGVRHDRLHHKKQAIPVSLLKEVTAKSACDRILILDACRSDLYKGARGQATGFRGTSQLRDLALSGSSQKKGGLAILCSCDEGAQAIELEDRRQGLFTAAFLSVLQEFWDDAKEVPMSSDLCNDISEKMEEVAAASGLSGSQSPWVEINRKMHPILPVNPSVDVAPNETLAGTSGTGDKSSVGSGGQPSTSANGGAAIKLATLEVSSEPPGAEVRIDGGRWKGKVPVDFDEVPWGERHYQAKYEGLVLNGLFTIDNYEHALALDFSSLASEKKEAEAELLRETLLESASNQNVRNRYLEVRTEKLRRKDQFRALLLGGYRFLSNQKIGFGVLLVVSALAILHGMILDPDFIAHSRMITPAISCMLVCGFTLFPHWESIRKRLFGTDISEDRYALIFITFGGIVSLLVGLIDLKFGRGWLGLPNAAGWKFASLCLPYLLVGVAIGSILGGTCVRGWYLQGVFIGGLSGLLASLFIIFPITFFFFGNEAFFFVGNLAVLAGIFGVYLSVLLDAAKVCLKCSMSLSEFGPFQRYTPWTLDKYLDEQKEEARLSAEKPEGERRARMPHGLSEVSAPVEIDFTALASGSREAHKQQCEYAEKHSLPVEVKNTIGMRFRLVPPGSFLMGSPDGEEDHEEDEILHPVTLTKPMYVGQYPVTQGEWQAVMGKNPSHFKEVGDMAPVERASWDDCQEFCRKLYDRDGVAAGTYRLLTEAEWEYACRAGTNTPFCYGSNLDSSMANFNGKFPYGAGKAGIKRETSTATGSFLPNGFGLFDMHGNVREWCEDNHAAYSRDAVTDPAGSKSRPYRVCRGGGCNDVGRHCRSARRDNYLLDLFGGYRGCRLLRTVPD